MSNLKSKDATRLAKCYSKALFTHAINKNNIDVVEKNIRQFIDILNENKNLFEILNNPSFHQNILIEILKDLFGKADFDNSVINLIMMLTVNRKMSIFYAVYNDFMKLVMQHKNIQEVNLYSVKEFSEQDKEILASNLKQYLNKDIKIKNKIVPKLLGGFQIEYDSNLIDLSLLGYINRISLELNKTISDLM